MKHALCFFCLLGLPFFLPFPLIAGQLVYQPINPAFGGNPMNGNFLIATAESQNQFTEDKKQAMVDNFEETLMRRVLSELSRKIIEESFGSFGDSLESGFYQLGDFNIEIDTQDGELVVIINDLEAGTDTIIDIPSNF